MKNKEVSNLPKVMNVSGSAFCGRTGRVAVFKFLQCTEYHSFKLLYPCFKWQPLILLYFILWMYSRHIFFNSLHICFPCWTLTRLRNRDRVLFIWMSSVPRIVIVFEWMIVASVFSLQGMFTLNPERDKLWLFNDKHVTTICIKTQLQSRPNLIFVSSQESISTPYTLLPQLQGCFLAFRLDSYCFHFQDPPQLFST